MHLINLDQVAMVWDLPHFWTKLVSAKKHHKLTVIQCTLDESAMTLIVCIPMVALSVLLCISIVPGIWLEYKDD